MELTPFPQFKAAALNWSPDNPVTQMWTRVAEVYRGVVQETTTQLWLSSAQIIQEHTVKAIIEAQQSCLDALTRNSAAVQQQALARIVDANQKAATIVTTEVTQAVVESMTPKE